MPKTNLDEGQSSSTPMPASSVDLAGSAGGLVDTARHNPSPASAAAPVPPQSTGLPVKPSAAEKFECLQPGQMLGCCRIERLLGHGGMGAVYLAHHLALDVPVAVKVLISRLGKDMSESVKRFVREARLASRIHHPNVVQMLDVETDEETGLIYIVQEYVGGGSVSDLMKKGVIEEGRALDIIIGVASALVAAAEFNIVHRDIKPENIMLSERGEAKLADLGIAKECSDHDGGLTLSHVMMGTPFYVAPEQARDTKRVDARADIYSLGATLYHMLCGQPPYPGETAFEVLSNLIVEPVPDPLLKRPDLSPAMAALIMWMLAKEPANRPATAAQLLDELKAVRQDLSGPQRSVFRQLQRFQDYLLKGRWRWLAGMVGMVVLAGGLWIGLDARNSHAPASPLKSLPSLEPKSQSKLATDREVVLPGKVMLALRACPAGTFMNGSPVDDIERDTEKLQEQVTLSLPFWMGKYEITQVQWQALMGNNPSKFKGADLPVEQVSWDDVMSFCKKLTVREAGRIPAGYEYRLPTEDEWEAACRAGNPGPYAGTGRLDDMGWFDDNSGGKTHSVGQKQPNAWGLYDMHGNVGEWSYRVEDSPVNISVNKVSSSWSAIRGGNWNCSANRCRAACRISGNPRALGNELGFRVALAPVISRPEPKPQATAKTGPGREIVLPGKVKLELLNCPAGTFTMGLSADEFDHGSGETQHQVTLTKPFWLGKCEVTQAQWQALMGNNPSNFKGVELPVEQVSWNDAVAFCEKLTVNEVGRIPAGYEYRLPTEAEWEYACRAGNPGRYADTGRLEDMGWYGDNSGGKTHPVGQKQPNAWGLYDMHGNVCEWCSSYDDNLAAVTDSVGSSTKKAMAIRGGNWNYSASHRAADRIVGDRRFLGNELGFRVALAPAFPKPESPPPVVLKSQAKPGPGREFMLQGKVKLELLNCPAGTFTMGSPVDEFDRGPAETQHQVTLTRPFWLGKYEVTQAQWQVLMGDNPSNFKGADLPVEQVSWTGAMEFCKKLTANEAGRIPAGYEFRLPTEAEWEYACRAGNPGRYAGTGRLEDMGWYGDNSGGKTHPVGQKQPNAWGLYDMHGNAYEWCSSCDDESAAAVTDPIGSSTKEVMAMRGGNWNYSASRCRAAYRIIAPLRFLGNELGFRVALAPAFPKPESPPPVVLKSQAKPGPGREFMLLGKVKLELRDCPAGTFTMGSPVNEAERKDNENQHQVTLVKPFWLGKYEVTQGQWQVLMGDNPSNFKGADLPVEQVSWTGAMEFCKKLTASEAGRIPAGYEFRLPTEAEWEYGCRAGGTGSYAGTGCLDDMGWSAGNSGGQSHPVGQKQPNAWGLYDMHGNVFEWCLDLAGNYSENAVSDPTGPVTGTRRMGRGGSWLYGANDCRAACRGSNFPGFANADQGFRVALAPVVR